MKKSTLMFDGSSLELLIIAIKGGLVDAYFEPFEEAVLDMFLDFLEKHSKDGNDFVLTLEAD